ncbi:MAG: hypothetical protein KKD44_05540 [Proteobacteria bacterium]|nr:hypothetical protein [Pseudomonadota bacterium]
MQYLVAAGLIVFFLAIWIGVDYLSQKRGLRNYDEPRITCTGCQCGGTDTCQIKGKEEKGQDDAS